MRKIGRRKCNTEMKPLVADPATYARSKLMVARTKLPEGLVVEKEIGKGSNNKVFACTTADGTECVLRAPRRRSDTQQRGSAVWEFRHTLKASQLGVGPTVYHAWCARHATGRWPSGLYVVTERFSHDLDDVLLVRDEMRDDYLARCDEVGDALVECLKTLSDALIFVYDLKPSNVVVDLDGDSARTKIIDFGRDFCEWAGCEQDPESRTPIVDMLRKRVRARDGEGRTVDAVVSHVLFAAMLVVLSATTTYRLHDERTEHRMGAAERQKVHPVAARTRDLLDSMQGQNLALLREVLRSDDVRGVLRHYHGRRNAGTRRTLRLARGVEL